jgi:hypothetical protein
MSFKKLTWMLVALSFFVAEAARAEVTVTENETYYFGGITFDLQRQLAESSTSLNTPAGVKQFRDRAQVLRLLADVLGFERGDWNPQSRFAGYLYKTNFWVNRNLRLANVQDQSGQNLFPAMFAVLDSHTDREISERGDLRKPLIAASKAIEDTSFLESPAEQPEAARLSDKELDLAVLFAAMGVISSPGKIDERGLDHVSDITSALKFFKDFLTNQTALRRLRALSISNSIAAIALGIVDTPKFSEFVETLAAFGTAGVDVKVPSQSAARNALDSLIDVVRNVKSDYEAQSAPASPRRDLPGILDDLSRNVPFIRPGPPYPAAAKPAFDPRSSVDLATLSSKLMHDMALQAANFANDLDEDQEIARLREFQALRTIAESLDWVIAGWQAGEQKQKAFVRLLYQVNPWVMRNLLALRREEGVRGGSQIERLKAALKKYDVGAIRTAAVAVQARQFEESVAAVPQEVTMDENDQLGVVSIALAYLRVAPEILIHDLHWRVGNARPDVSQIADNVRQCLQVVAGHQALVHEVLNRFQRSGRISNLNWNVWYDAEFPIAKLAERAHDLVSELDLVKMSVNPGKHVTGWAPQIIRLCLGAGVRKGETDQCGHWDLLDAHFGILSNVR